MEKTEIKVIGIIGGGQLGKMISIAAKQMGFTVGILDPIPDCPAGQVSDWQIIAAYDDEQALQSLYERCDVLTYELEHLDAKKIKKIEDKLPQGLQLLEQTQDRLLEKNFLKSLGIPVVPYQAVEDHNQARQAAQALGLPVVLKKRTGGYDGKSQWRIDSLEALENLDEELFKNCIIEKWQTFSKELSIMIGRNDKGETCLFPVAENTHYEHILANTIVPAHISVETIRQIEKWSIEISQKLFSQGVLGIEWFYGEDGSLYVNELAPRPHNSGHYSIEACDYSQFSIHVRALCQWELPERVWLFAPVKMENILGQNYEEAKKRAISDPRYHFHDYGKIKKSKNRKVGHLTYFIRLDEE